MVFGKDKVRMANLITEKKELKGFLLESENDRERIMTSLRTAEDKIETLQNQLKKKTTKKGEKQ